MKPFVVVVVASLLAFVAPPRAGARGAGQAAAPPGWSETKRKALDLNVEGKDLEALDLFRKWVAQHPDFGDGHWWLGGAHESVARAMVVSRAPDARTTAVEHFEAAALHMRRGLELAGPDASFMMMRPLIDLHGVIGLDRPAEYERLVREGVKRFPADPYAHAYVLVLLAGKGQPIEAAARAARAAIPAGPDARADMAGLMVGHVRTFGRLTPEVAPVLLPEASRLVDEALALKPGHASALRLRGDIRSMQSMSPDRPTADEDAVRGGLRMIASGQMVYAGVCGHGHYAPTLADLARPAPGKALGYITTDLVPAGRATVLERYRYRIEMTAVPSPRSAASCNGVPAGGSAETFSVVARPLDGFQGRAFRIDAEGTITEIK